MNSPLENRKVRLRGPRGLGLLAVALMLVVAGPLPAQVGDEQARKAADAAISRVRSPYCPGLMLEVCPSTQAEALRDSIRQMAAQGQSANAIVEDVLARHGEEWRAVPKRSGAGLLAWLILPMALVVGGLVLWGRIRVMRSSGPAPAAAGAQVSDDERARLDAALREFEQAEDAA
ncbi:MAG TPA: cytochrome c-type biogenesis protein CcmH [Longimicrobium sp.]|nr:cytochrome c-type biogenesis protein CcmH [Longimicrobium sp.]